LFVASVEELGILETAKKVRPTRLSIEQDMPDRETSYTVSIKMDHAGLFLGSSVRYRLMDTVHATHWVK